MNTIRPSSPGAAAFSATVVASALFRQEELTDKPPVFSDLWAPVSVSPPESLPHAAAPGADGSGRRFLLATLPYGPFGGHLNRALRRRGAETRHMVFNLGDALSGRGPGGVIHGGTIDAWVRRLPDLARDSTDIVLFGDGGPYKQAALDLDRSTGPRLWVLESGYFRPDWITLEQDGVNAASRLPRRAAAYAAAPPMLPSPVRTGPSQRHFALHIGGYYAAELLGRPFFSGYRPSFEIPPARQALGHVLRKGRGLFRGPDGSEAVAIGAGGPFFLVCLQRDGDSQLQRHSDLADNAAFMTAVMDSFARHAPGNARLVVKNHPLDHGVIDHRRQTMRLAASRGLGDRAAFIEGGRLAVLCRASRGVVVNNSSAAFSALGFGAPVKALGRAVFDFEGLADQQPLDGFWNSPQAPDAALFERFKGHVLAATQVNGSFDDPRLRRRTAEAVADILVGHPPAWRSESEAAIHD